jgi:CRP/FNR family transcriptional regulator
LWQALDRLKCLRTYEKGTPVFQQGHPAEGIYLIEKGEVRLTLPSGAQPGRTFEIVGPGAMLGLSETMTGEAHKLSAEAVSHTEIACVERGKLLAFLREHHQFCLQIVHLLSDDLHGLYQRFQCMSSEERPRRRASPASVN